MQRVIAGLLKKHVYLGTSSWKYPGWKGLVYKKSYQTEKDFNNNCLSEYAEHYPAVGVDHTFYAWPTEKGMQKYVEQTPEYFRFGLKVTERITIFKYPKFPRYGKEAGKRNDSFLDVGTFRHLFLEPIGKFKGRLGPILFEFSQFFPGTVSSGSEFVSLLDRFFAELAVEKGFQFAVEMRNRNWLKKPYFDVLAKHGVAHVFNSWTRMPAIGEQVELSATSKLPCFVARVLLKPGTSYEQAVEAFSPYDKIKDEQPQVRKDTAQLIKRAIELGVPAYVFVNNRCEGSAPQTLQGILELLTK